MHEIILFKLNNSRLRKIKTDNKKDLPPSNIFVQIQPFGIY